MINLSCLSNCCNQTISLSIDDKTQCLEFVKDFDALTCLTNFQKIKESSRKVQNSVVDFLVP